MRPKETTLAITATETDNDMKPPVDIASANVESDDDADVSQPMPPYYSPTA